MEISNSKKLLPHTGLGSHGGIKWYQSPEVMATEQKGNCKDQEGAAATEQVRKIIKKVRRTIGKLGGQEHRETFVRRRKLKTGMIPKQKNLPRDPVL